MTSPDPLAVRVSSAADNEALIADFRAHRGEITSGPEAGNPLLLLTTIGVKTGQRRVAPIAYTRDGNSFVIVASKSGAPTHPAWYLNIVANPIVTVEVGEDTFEARASVARGAERDRLYAVHAQVFPVFNVYQQMTSRVIPVVLLKRVSRTRRPKRA